MIQQPSPLKRIALSAALATTLAGCPADFHSVGTAYIRLFPVLDSMFVGGGLPRRQVTYYDANGTVQNPGTIHWVSGDPTVLDVDSSTGRITGLKAGSALVVASALGVQGSALIAVSAPLQVTLLIDSVYLMPGDTFTVPIHVSQQAAGTPSVWFSAAPNAVFDIDSVTGRDSAKSPGGPVQFIVHAALGPDSVSDSGTVEVVQLTDTIGGKASFAMFGTVIRSRKAAARALTFPRRGDTLTFRLRAPIVGTSGTTEFVAITLRTPPAAPGTFPIDSISPDEALQFDPYCRPPRSWGTWSIITSQSQLDALSRPGSSITITSMVPVANGMAISGRFYLPAQRLDLYDDPLGVVPIRGTFVAPLSTTTTRCE